MKTPHYDAMQKFTLKNIPDLDICVLGALELFSAQKVPSIPFKQFKRPLVIGSGNAEATGKIIFKDADAVFANENTYEEKLKKLHELNDKLANREWRGEADNAVDRRGCRRDEPDGQRHHRGGTGSGFVRPRRRRSAEPNAARIERD